MSNLNDKISSLQSEIKKLQVDAILSMKPSKIDSTDTILCWTRSDSEKFSAVQTSTEKRQTLYDSWKIQIQQVLIVDGSCFPGSFNCISYVTSQLSGKAWEAIKDGVQKMNSYPSDSEKWHWRTQTDLWQVLDRRYILLDTTQMAKNALDTLYQDKCAYGEFKADFDHYLERAKCNDQTKVDLLRKRLNRKITGIINNQVNLPDSDNYTGWSDMINNIARNIKQQEHILMLLSSSNSM